MHFTVAVITDEKPTEDMIAGLLAPYQENNMGDCPREYMEFNDIEDEALQNYENEGERKIKMPDGRLLSPWDEEFRTNGIKGSFGFETHKIPDGCEEVIVPFKELYPTFEIYMKDYCGHEEKDEEKGRYGYWYNPQSQWDWWEIGGRWAGLLRVPADSISAKENIRGCDSFSKRDDDGDYVSDDKNIVLVDSARIKDIICFSEEDRKRGLRLWELIIDEQPPFNDEEKEMLNSSCTSKETLLNDFQTKEKYAAYRSALHTYAVVTDDDWYEVSKDIDCPDYGFKALVLDNAGENDWVTIVDCHV
ncbi:MAG: hypothetical protein FWH03_05500 [Firmicutes bacterium]|nr:hypothetical protein [Bacillota bacterium]